jgi:Ca2+-binding EF-hand superfamily protein
MRLILSKIGQHFTEKEIKDMIATVDTDKNGKLSFDGNDVFKKS